MNERRERYSAMMDARFGGAPRLTRRQALLAGALGAGALIGGGPSVLAPARAAAQQSPKRGGTLKTNFSDAAPDGLDPVNYDKACCTDRFLRPSIFDGLVKYGADGTTIEPALASAWEISDDGLAYTFKLRAATFHDGSPVTAADVVYSLGRIASGTQAPHWPAMTFETPVANTVVLRLHQPNAPLLANLANIEAGIISQRLHEADPNGYITKPIGAGPFRVESWQGASLELVRHDGYWNTSKPYLDRVSITYLDYPQRLDALRSGDLDLVVVMPGKQANDVAAIPGATAIPAPLAELIFYPFPVEIPPYDDPKLRLALNYALDRQALVAAVGGTGVPADKLFPPGMQFRDEESSGYTYDPEKAKALIAESAGKDGFSAVLRYDYNAPYGDFAQALHELVAEQLRAVGGNVIAVKQDAPATAMASDAPNMWWYDSITTSADPEEWLAMHARSDTNITTYGYANPKVDALVDQGLRDTDPAARAATYQKLQNIIAEDAPYLLLYYAFTYAATAPHVNGFSWPLGGGPRLWEVWRDA